jgi:NAD(P)-dependent dehydrogenase (short-subunit alcohol dehydrogenase family)
MRHPMPKSVRADNAESRPMQSEKVVIVTGGSSGIGRAAALRFARQGDKVLVTGRRPGPIEEMIAEHANIAGLVADAATAEDAKSTIAKAVDTWGKVDALVNNAGAGAILPLADTTADRIMDIFSVNVFGPSLLASAALPHLRATRGTIVNVSSTFGHKPAAGLSHYAASKAALEHLTRCWALDLPHSAYG